MTEKREPLSVRGVCGDPVLPGKVIENKPDKLKEARAELARRLQTEFEIREAEK